MNYQKKIDDKLVTGINTEAFKDTPIEDLILPRSALSFSHYAGYQEDFFPSDSYDGILLTHEDVCDIVEEDLISEYKRFSTGCPIHKTLSKTDPVLIPGEDNPFNGYEVVVNLAYYETTLMRNNWSAGVFSASTLREIFVPREMFYVSSNAFSDMENLEAIHVEEGNAHYRSEDGVLYDENVEWLYFYPPAKSDSDFMIPGTVENIGTNAFSFQYNPYLESISVSPEHAHFRSLDGVLYDKDEKTLVVYPSARKDSSYVVKDTVTKINDFAFQYADQLRTITLPDDSKKSVRVPFA